MSEITTLKPQLSLDDPDTESWFWTIVDASVVSVQDEQLRKLGAELKRLSDQQLVDFIGLYQLMHDRLYSRRLWAAAYLINGGCSDDGFIDFRAWLIASGRRVTEAAISDADSLADLEVEMDGASFELFGYVPGDAFRDRADGAYPDISPRPHPAPSEPDWDFDFDDDDEMRHRLPRLAAQFLS